MGASKKIVMCDTMIWYDIYNGVETFKKDKFNYYGSGSNIGDFLSSNKMNGTESEKVALKNAIKTMYEQSDEVLLLDPMTVAAKNLLGTKVPPSEIIKYQEVYNKLINLSQNKISQLYGPGVADFLQQKIRFQNATLNFKVQIENIRKEGKRTQTEIENLIENHIVEWLIGEFNYFNNTNAKPELITNWEPIVLFVKCYKEFILRLDTNALSSQNTMVDLVQLLYINLDESILIWTKENQIISRIRSQFSIEECKKIIYQDYLNNI